MPRARNAAAASSPMKLAPITTARRAPLMRCDDRPAIGQRTQDMDMRLVGARNRKPNRLGARREQQTVVGNGAAVGDDDIARLGVDRRDVAS